MPKILVVDDESLDREMAARCLRPLKDLELSFARDGQEALQHLEQEVPDLILTDLRMPNMDGLELVQRTREDLPTLPVLLMTSKGNERIAVRALRAGASSYLPKRDMKQDLVAIVTEILELAEATRARQRIQRFLDYSETRLSLENDPALIAGVVSYLQDNLTRISLADEYIRTQVGIALMEALSNAMVHGNLEVDSGLRRTDQTAFDRLVRQRLKEAPFAQRRTRCIARQTPEEVEYEIRDEGPGFDPTTLPDPRDDANLLEVSGRGIMLMQTFMDRVEYNKIGNRVRMVKTLKHQNGGEETS